MMSPLVKLPSGTILDLSAVRMIVRKEINSYLVFFENLPHQAIITGEDLDALLGQNLVSVVSAPTPALQAG